MSLEHYKLQISETFQQQPCCDRWYGGAFRGARASRKNPLTPLVDLIWDNETEVTMGHSRARAVMAKRQGDSAYLPIPLPDGYQAECVSFGHLPISRSGDMLMLRLHADEKEPEDALGIFIFDDGAWHTTKIDESLLTCTLVSPEEMRGLFRVNDDVFIYNMSNEKKTKIATCPQASVLTSCHLDPSERYAILECANSGRFGKNPTWAYVVVDLRTERSAILNSGDNHITAGTFSFDRLELWMPQNENFHFVGCQKLSIMRQPIASGGNF